MSQVAIHKRNRKSPTQSQEQSPSIFDSGSNLPKRKKYKIIPNSVTSSTGEQSVTISSLPENDDVNSSIGESEIPSDRKELLKFVSNSTNIRELIKTIEYNNNFLLFLDQKHTSSNKICCIFENFY